MNILNCMNQINSIRLVIYINSKQQQQKKRTNVILLHANSLQKYKLNEKNLQINLEIITLNMNLQYMYTLHLRTF